MERTDKQYISVSISRRSSAGEFRLVSTIGRKVIDFQNSSHRLTSSFLAVGPNSHTAMAMLRDLLFTQLVSLDERSWPMSGWPQYGTAGGRHAWPSKDADSGARGSPVIDGHQSGLARAHLVKRSNWNGEDGRAR